MKFEKKINFYAKCYKNLLFIENVTTWPFNLVNTNMVSDLVKIFFFNFKSILTIALSKYKNNYSKIWLFAKCFVLFWCRCMMVSSFSLSPFWVHIYYQHNWLWIIIDIYSTPPTTIQLLDWSWLHFCTEHIIFTAIADDDDDDDNKNDDDDE